MKQKEYRETYSLAQSAPYQIGDDAYKDHHGVAAQWFCFGLRRGRTSAEPPVPSVLASTSSWPFLFLGVDDLIKSIFLHSQ
jgi:hypothetical protein